MWCLAASLWQQASLRNSTARIWAIPYAGSVRAEVTGGKIGDRPGLAAEPRACHLFDLPLPMSECYLSRVCGPGIVPCAAPGRGPAYEEIS